MPQLDPSSFSEQLFWLLITFVSMYYVVARLSLPKISSIVQGRQSRISADLEKAANFQEESEVLEAQYEKSVEESRVKANAVIAKASEKANTYIEKKLAELQEEIAVKAKESDKEIQKAKEKAHGEISAITTDILPEIVEQISSVKITKGQAALTVSKIIKEND